MNLLLARVRLRLATLGAVSSFFEAPFLGKPLLGKPLLGAVFIASLCLCGPLEALACSFLPVSAQEMLQRADSVFAGEVLAVETPEDDGASAESPWDVTVRFKVLRWFKGGSSEAPVSGGAGQTVIIKTTRDTCGLSARPGSRMLIFASGAPLRSNLPAGSREVESVAQAEELLAEEHRVDDD